MFAWVFDDPLRLKYISCKFLYCNTLSLWAGRVNLLGTRVHHSRWSFSLEFVSDMSLIFFLNSNEPHRKSLASPEFIAIGTTDL